MKRNTVEYDTAGAATQADAEELVRYDETLLEEVVTWLRAHHPYLLGTEKR